MYGKVIAIDFLRLIRVLDQLVKSGVLSDLDIFDAEENRYDEVTVFNIRPMSLNFIAVLSNRSTYIVKYRHNDATNSGSLHLEKITDEIERRFLDAFS